MSNIAYEQFETWCKHWNYTIEEGYKAMCFTANIIGQNYGNCIDYAQKVSSDDKHSDAFKRFAEMKLGDARILLKLYGSLESTIFNVLETHEKKQAN